MPKKITGREFGKFAREQLLRKFEGTWGNYRPRYIKNIRYPKYIGNTVVSDKKTRPQNTIGHSRFPGRP
jgi:hypothetical protein